MARVIDYIYLILTVVVFGGGIALILFIVNAVSKFKSAANEKLKTHGYSFSREGVQVQTQKRFNREDYVDATQRGFVKAFGASTFGKTKDDSVSKRLKTSEYVQKLRNGFASQK